MFNILIADGKLLIDLKADGDKGRWVTSSSSRVYWPPPASLTARIDSTTSQHTITGMYQNYHHTITIPLVTRTITTPLPYRPGFVRLGWSYEKLKTRKTEGLSIIDLGSSN